MPREVCRRNPGAPLCASRRNALQLCPLGDLRIRPHRRSAQSGNIARRVHAGTDFIHHAAVINVGANFAAQFATRHNPQSMIEFARDDLHLARIIVKVRLFACDFQMPGAREIARDVLFLNDALDRCNRLQRRGVHAPRQLAPVHRDQFVDAELQPGEHHAAIARTRAPANGFRFQHHHFRAAPG